MNDNRYFHHLDEDGKVKTNRVVYLDGEVRIIGKKAPILVIAVLAVLFIITAFLPLFIFFYWLSLKEGFHIGFFAVFFLWGPAYFLGRSILWNLYGQESIKMDKGRMFYHADYKYYKDAHESVDYMFCELEAIEVDDTQTPHGVMALYDNEFHTETSMRIPVTEIEKIRDYFNL